MNATTKIRKASSVSNGIMFLLAGLVLIGIAVFMLSQNTENYIETTAVIEDIVYDFSAPDNTSNHTVLVGYTVDGKEYHGIELGEYNAAMDVGEEVTIKYNPDNPSEITTNGARIVPFIMIAFGALVVFIAIRSIKNAKKAATETPYRAYEQISYNPEDVAKVESDTSPLKKYYFHFDGGVLKQGHVMENERKDVVFDGKMLENSLIGDMTYEFSNKLTYESKTVKVSHPVTVSTSSTHGAFTHTINSTTNFKIDGVNCWELLKNLSFSFDYSMNGMKPHFNIYHFGVNVGTIDTTSTKLYEEDEAASTNPMTKLGAPGFYRIMCKEADMETVFYMCFILTKTIGSH